MTVDHIYSNRVIKALIDEFGNKIILIVESGKLLNNKSYISSLFRYWKTSGSYYVFAQAIKLEIYKLLSKFYSLIFSNDTKKKFYSYKTLANKHKIPRRKIANINDEATIKFFKRKKPDLFVSVFFNQLIKPENISIPIRGVINIHPAYLPDYKGVSPVFWALVNGEKFSGVTIHYVDNSFDTGKIIAREKVVIDKKDSEDSLYWKSALAGVPLLISTIQELKKGKIRTFPNIGGRYFSLPTKQAIGEFKRKKRSFFNLKEYLFQN